MPLRGWQPTGTAMLASIVLAAALPRVGGAATNSVIDGAPQAVLVLTGNSLLQHRLPAFVQIQPGRFVAARTVQAACFTPRLRADSLLLFLPDSGQCQLVAARNLITLPRRVERLTGRRWMDKPRVGLLEQPYLAIVPARDLSRYARAACTCTNTPPTGTVMCDAQTRNAGTPINPIVFLAEDADNDSLEGTFSYQRDADPVQAGLPASLSSSCVPAAGSLQCTVQGSAPAPAGIVQLNLTVTDGQATLPLDSLLEILAPVADRIFADSFESPGCP